MKFLMLFFPLFIAVISFGQHEQILFRESNQSLYIETYRGNEFIGSAAGYVIRYKKQYYLVTSYHSLTNKTAIGQEWVNEKPVTPDRIAIYHNTGQKGKFFVKFENLFSGDGKTPRWLENIARINKVDERTDVVELPLTDTAGITLAPVDYKDSATYTYRGKKNGKTVYKYKDVIVQTYPVALKKLRSQDSAFVPAAGLTEADIIINDSIKQLMIVSENDLVEMSGSPVFLYNDKTTSFHRLVGMYSRLPDAGSTFLRSSFIGKHLQIITKKKVPGVRTLQYAGTFSYGTGHGRSGTIIIYPETDTTVLFYIELSGGGPSDSTDALYGRTKIIKSNGTFYAQQASASHGCQWTFKYKNEKTTLILKTAESESDCGFGKGVYADGAYKRKSRKVRTFFTDAEGRKVYFNTTKPEDFKHFR